MIHAHVQAGQEVGAENRSGQHMQHKQQRIGALARQTARNVEPIENNAQRSTAAQDQTQRTRGRAGLWFRKKQAVQALTPRPSGM
jgi:hypothetical protein